MRHLSSLVLAITTILLLSCVQNETLHLTSVKTDEHIFVAEGLYMFVAPGYIQANSYKGFQVHDKSSSVSVKLSYETIEGLKAFYNSDRFKRSNLKLLELSTVIHEGLSEGLLCRYRDKRSGFISTNVYLPKPSGVVVQATFLCHESMLDRYNKNIERMVKSIYLDTDKPIAVEDAPDEPFQLANGVVERNGSFTIDFDQAIENPIYTRDGLLPTQSADSLTVYIKNTARKSYADASTFIKNYNPTKGKCKFTKAYSLLRLSNGKELAKDDFCDGFYYRILMFDAEERFVLITVKSLEEASSREAISYFKKQFTSRDIFGYQ